MSLFRFVFSFSMEYFGLKFSLVVSLVPRLGTALTLRCFIKKNTIVDFADFAKVTRFIDLQLSVGYSVYLQRFENQLICHRDRKSVV